MHVKDGEAAAAFICFTYQWFKTWGPTGLNINVRVLIVINGRGEKNRLTSSV